MNLLVLDSPNEEYVDLLNTIDLVMDSVICEHQDDLEDNIIDETLGVLFDLDSQQKQVDKLVVKLRKLFPEITLIGLSNKLIPKKLIKHQKSKYGLDLYIKTPVDEKYLKLLFEQLFDVELGESNIDSGNEDATQDIVIPEEVRSPPTFDMLRKSASEDDEVDSESDLSDQEDLDEDETLSEVSGSDHFEEELVTVKDEIVQLHMENKELSVEGQKTSQKIDAIFSDVFSNDYANSAANMESLADSEKIVDKVASSDDIAMVDNIDDLLEDEDLGLSLSQENETMASSDDIELDSGLEETANELSLSGDDEGLSLSDEVDQADELSLDLSNDDTLSLGGEDAEPESLDIDAGQSLDLGASTDIGLSLSEEGDEVESLEFSTDIDLDSEEVVAEETQALTEIDEEESLEISNNFLGEDDSLSLGDESVGVDESDLEFNLEQDTAPEDSAGQVSAELNLSDEDEDEDSLLGDLEFSVNEDDEDEIAIEESLDDPLGVMEDADLDFSAGADDTLSSDIEVESTDEEDDFLSASDEIDVDEELLFDSGTEDEITDEAEVSIAEDDDVLEFGVEEEEPSGGVDLADNVSQVNIDKLNLDDSQAEIKRKQVENELDQFLMESSDDIPEKVSSNDVDEVTKTTDILVSQSEKTSLINTNDLKVNTAEKEFDSFVSDQTKEDHRTYVKHNDDEMIRLGETIKNLREDREDLLKKLYDLEAKIGKDEKNVLNLQSLVDEKKIEMSVIKKRYDREIDHLKFQLNLKKENEEIYKEKKKIAEEEALDKIRESKLNERRIRSRERELEEKIEMLKSDSEVQLNNRDKKILALKRRIDTLEFDIESSHIKEHQSKNNQNELEQKMDRVIDTLRNAIEHLDTDSEAELRREKLKNNLDV